MPFRSTHGVDGAKKFHINNECLITDITLAKLLENKKIIGYEHMLLLFQDKTYGSNIEGSVEGVNFCSNIRNNSMKLFYPKRGNSGLFFNFKMLENHTVMFQAIFIVASAILLGMYYYVNRNILNFTVLFLIAIFIAYIL